MSLFRVMMPTVSSLVAPEVNITATSGAIGNDEVGIMMTVLFSVLHNNPLTVTSWFCMNKQIFSMITCCVYLCGGNGDAISPFHGKSPDWYFTYLRFKWIMLRHRTGAQWMISFLKICNDEYINISMALATTLKSLSHRNTCWQMLISI